MRLTETFIETISPPQPGIDGKGRQAFYRDSELVGFALRVASGGTKSYVLERRIRGKVKRITLGRCSEMALFKARARAEKLIGEIERENAPRIINGEIVDEQISLLAAFQTYLTAHTKLNRLTIRDYQHSMQGPLKDWQTMPVRDLTEAMVQAKHATLGKISQSRSNNAMRLLRAILNHVTLHLITEHHCAIIKHNPVDILSHKQIWYTRQSTANHFNINSEQLKTWWQVTRQVKSTSSRDYLYFLLLSGLPHTIVSVFTFDMVDYDNKTILFKNNNQTQKLPLPNYLIELIRKRNKMQRESGANYIFPGINKDRPLSDPRATIKRIQDISGIHFTQKGLHQTFMSLAQQTGLHQMTLKLISKIFRNTSNTMTEHDVNMFREIQERVFLTVFFVIGSIT